MVRINYNQKETERRPGCLFNCLLRIIWFCQGRPGPTKKRKMKKRLKLHGKESAAAFLNTVHRRRGRELSVKVIRREPARCVATQRLEKKQKFLK